MLDRVPNNRSDEERHADNFAGLVAHWNSPRDTLRRAHYYSRFVKFMKGILPLAAFGVGAAVLFYVTQHKDLSSFALTFERMGRIENDLTMIHPRLTGTEEDGSPYTINAETAIQEDPKTMRIRLRKLDGVMASSDGTQMHLIATEGRYDAAAHLLFVFNGARLLTADGYDMRTTAATIDTKAGVISGDQRVIGDGPAGHIEADAFVSNKRTKLNTFTGHVHMLLNQSPAAAKPGAKAAKTDGAKSKDAKTGDDTANGNAQTSDTTNDKEAKPTQEIATPALRTDAAETGK